jgi:hypothetical protein
MHVPRLYTLQEAAQLLSPDGSVTPRALRTMARQGRLQVIRIANKDFVTAEAVNAMLTSSTLTLRSPSCRDAGCLPDSICADAVATERPPGSFSTERKKLARAQAEMTVQALKQRCKPTSPDTTDRRAAPISPNSSSSRKW